MGKALIKKVLPVILCWKPGLSASIKGLGAMKATKARKLYFIGGYSNGNQPYTTTHCNGRIGLFIMLTFFVAVLVICTSNPISLDVLDCLFYYLRVKC